MPERRLGAVLLESGRINDADVARALEYQRTHGGFFGQSLVALGVVSREEIDWALASHFDLPFIFPKADAVDIEAAHLVPPEWALAHQAVPIVRAGSSITVVVAEPLPAAVIDELRSRTGCEVELALASATRIRELIHALYDAPAAQHVEHQTPVALADLMAHALEHGVDRFGVSIRGVLTVGWWRTRGEVRRAPLLDGWEAALSDTIRPSPLERLRDPADGYAVWAAALNRGGAELPLEASLLVGAGGAELMFRPLTPVGPAAVPIGIALPPSVVTELRMLWRGGSARVGVAAAQPDIARAVLPLLPGLSLGEQVRAAHINATGSSEAAYTIRATADVGFPDAVAAFGLDALTIDLPADGYAVGKLLRAAPLAFSILEEPVDPGVAEAWDLNWRLSITGQPGSLAWDLRALHR
jgi:hypothetical protein